MWGLGFKNSDFEIILVSQKEADVTSGPSGIYIVGE